MRKVVFSALFITALAATPANAEFIGKLAFKPKGCQAAGKCKIVHDFKYIGPNKIGWLTKADDETDGASIPAWAQPFIGNPFDKSFIKAAVIHDHYCNRHVRTWRQTHMVFYDALLETGLDGAKAKLMYYAVYLGGPKWVALILGNDCGDDCRWMQPFSMPLNGAGGPTLANNETTEKPPKNLIVRAAEYDEPGFSNELKDVEKLLREEGDAVSLSALEERAKMKKPNDFYYKHEDAVSPADVTKDEAK